MESSHVGYSFRAYKVPNPKSPVDFRHYHFGPRNGVSPIPNEIVGHLCNFSDYPTWYNSAIYMCRPMQTAKTSCILPP